LARPPSALPSTAARAYNLRCVRAVMAATSRGGTTDRVSEFPCYWEAAKWLV
jgi:hypothetical protein